MKELIKIYDRIIQRVNVNLREHDYDVNPFVQNLISPDKMVKFLCILRDYTPPSPQLSIQALQLVRQPFFREMPGDKLAPLQKRHPRR